jgi:hypothetical protein
VLVCSYSICLTLQITPTLMAMCDDQQNGSSADESRT